MRKLFTVVALISLLALPLRASAQDKVSYSGSSTIGQGILNEGGAIKAFESKTGVKFALFEIPGSGKGIKALIEGRVNVAGVSRPLEDKEKREGILGHTMAMMPLRSLYIRAIR